MKTRNTVAVVCILLAGVGCAQQTKPAGNPGFEQKTEQFIGVAKNTDAGARLQLDNGSTITCIVETESGGNAWPDDVNNARIRVEGYRIRSDSTDPSGIVLRCVNWTKIPAEPGNTQN